MRCSEEPFSMALEEKQNKEEEMVHVKKCPLGKRGRPSTEFYLNGKPQIYCYGWIDKMTDEPIDECRKCLDHVKNAENDLNQLRSKMKGESSNDNNNNP